MYASCMYVCMFVCEYACIYARILCVPFSSIFKLPYDSRTLSNG